MHSTFSRIRLENHINQQGQGHDGINNYYKKKTNITVPQQQQVDNTAPHIQLQRVDNTDHAHNNNGYTLPLDYGVKDEHNGGAFATNIQTYHKFVRTVNDVHDCDALII